MNPLAREARLALRERVRLLIVFALCWNSPKHLLAEITAFSPDQQDEFGFNMFEPDKPWFWQSELVDDIMEHNKVLLLKARQLGATWVCAAIALWYFLFRPGSYCLLLSHTEEDAKEIIARIWTMYESLPAILKMHVELITPERAEIPSEWMRVKHRNGRVSRLRALPATKKSVRSANASLILMDEAAYMDYAREIYVAANPATSRGAKLIVCSTANGVSNEQNGEGNFFHHLYVKKEEYRLFFRFLPWNLHPERDEAWYESEAMALPEQERNQEYPLNEKDAFILSGALFFDREALAYYRAHCITEPAKVGQFYSVNLRTANFITTGAGWIQILELPREGAKYAIGSDTSTGSGADFSSAHVVDLDSGAVVAHMHAKCDAPRWAEQLHYLGMWYNTARIAIELGGGYGDAVVIALKDGAGGRPPYRKLYAHRVENRGKRPIADRYGFPITEGSRKQILDELQSALMNRRFPWLDGGTMDELGAFVYADTRPSPRAQEGMNDDRVLSLALATEMFRQFGKRPGLVERRRSRRKKNRGYTPHPSKAGATR